MAKAKSERILNLTLYLLSARRFVSREQIRLDVEGYAGLSNDAFERAFERDKDDLRELGIPIQTGSNSALFDDDVGYRIARADFELPAVSFTKPETQVLGVATHVWDQATMAESTVAALAKLRAAGVDVDTSRLTTLAPTINARDSSFVPLWQATTARKQVKFAYKSPDALRTVEPWRILYRSGAWYVVGFDVDKAAARMFRLSRIASDVRVTNKTFDVPEDIDLDSLTNRFSDSPPERAAIVAVRPGRAAFLRRSGTPAVHAKTPHGYESYRVLFWGLDYFAGMVRSAGSDVLVLDPPELRDKVLRGLRQVVDTP